MQDNERPEVTRASNLEVNFQISDSAYFRIMNWIEYTEKKENKKLVAAIFMLYALDKNADAVGPAMPAVGANAEDEVFDDQIHVYKKLRYTFPVLEEDHALFEGKTLDFHDNAYVLT